MGDGPFVTIATFSKGVRKQENSLLNVVERAVIPNSRFLSLWIVVALDGGTFRGPAEIRWNVTTPRGTELAAHSETVTFTDDPRTVQWTADVGLADLQPGTYWLSVWIRGQLASQSGLVLSEAAPRP